MNPNASLPSERAAIVGTIDPDANAAGALNTDEIDMKLFDRVMFIVMAGALGTSATLDFKVQEGTSGAVTTDMTGKAITQLTQAGTDDDKQAIVNVRSDELVDGNTHIKGVLTTAVATSDSAVIALGFDARYHPANDNDLASVDEIVA